MGILLNNKTVIFVEESALPGVKRVAACVASDMEKVFGKGCHVVDSKPNDTEPGDNYITVLTLGHSSLANDIDVSDIEGKREVYKFVNMDGKLIIVGSDKRGTIYGLFYLSELLGVSALVDWFKLPPAKMDSFELEEDDLITSKEPSVRFRGFFINDEWPAFGNWCNKNYDGFNAKAYEQIFLLLLRMKGNYMWPAMWSAIFPDDGPGLLNEELADELGVVMGMSHHEPCLRQGEEYRYLRGKDSIYGDAWNFRSNEEGITRFWEDGLKRSGRFENVITVGMRGEADTAIMGKDATLKDNIDLLRDVLKTQNRLIKENVCENLGEVPRMLALYKEVEPYFYGDENTKGLMGDPELEGVTLMLCDDNYGNLRTVPTEEMRSHKGGYGMYYHFDYHGYPISFEWVNSSYLPKVWEQMSSAYEFGIRDLWIVNVGDLFTMEYPLSYFLELAYDYEKWGINNLNSAKEYTELFVERCFGKTCADNTKKDMYDLLMGYTRMAHKRRPEAMSCDIYAPFAEGESQKLLAQIESLEALANRINDEVSEELKYPVFELMHYPAMANLNVQKLQVKTGLNHAYALRGQATAMKMADEVNSCLKYDTDLVDKLHEIDNGRWYGMGLSEHIGFKHWCEEECQYPVLHTFKVGNKPRTIVSIPGSSQYTEGGPWTGRPLIIRELLNPDVNEAYICLSSAGDKGSYSISTESSCLYLSNNQNETMGKLLEGETCGVEENYVKVILDRTKEVSKDNEIKIKTEVGNITIKVPVCIESEDELSSKYGSKVHLWMGRKEDTYMTRASYNYISIEAEDYSELISSPCEDKATFKVLPEYGKTVSAIKVFPVNKSFDEETAPKAVYTIEVKEAGEYEIEAYMNPSNAPFMDGHLYYGVSVNDEKMTKINALPEGFKVGDNQVDWLHGVLDNIRKKTSVHYLNAGVNKLSFYALSPSFVLEKIVIYKKGEKPEYTYLGPAKTYMTK